MYSSLMTITVEDKPDPARTSHFPSDVLARLLSSLSKIPRKQKFVLKCTRALRLLWELLRMVTTCEWKAVSINAFHPPSRLSRRGIPRSQLTTNILLVPAHGNQKSSKYGSAPELDLTPGQLFVGMTYSSWTTCEFLLVRLCNRTYKM